jgi:Zn-dependent M28 family amino/carboxypeptidase
MRDLAQRYRATPIGTMRKTPVVFLAAAVLVTACGDSASTSVDAYAADITAAADQITAEAMLTKINDLAADSMEGRGPGTVGEEKAVAYLVDQFKGLGLAPGNPDGTYLQNVELIGYTSKPTASFTVGGKKMAMAFPTDYVASSRYERPRTEVLGSDVVFVGYGVVAPEYGWDDYKDVDVRGKTVIMLVNDPAVRVAVDENQRDTTMFKGEAMTYYGRWTYKYEIATEKGAAAVLIVHETIPAGYGYSVVEGSFSREQFDIVKAGENTRVPVEGWLSLEKTKELFAAAGKDFDALHAAARTKEFRPEALGATADISVDISTRRVSSKNVVAKLEGATKPDEYVIYTAHWDHLGIDPLITTGDNISNGALDNASGTATMLEIAKAYAALGTKPDRSIIFLAVTAEEKGLLGARYYAQNPLYPLAATVANINMDGINQWGKTSDLEVIGLGNSTLDDIVLQLATKEGRTVRADAEPEKGYYYRSDHFEFAKEGVPALYTGSGMAYIGKDANYGEIKRGEYLVNDYHKVTDEVKPDWDLAGAVDDAKLLFRVGYIVSQTPTFQEWKAGTEFKAKRDAMMGGTAK